MKPVTRLPIFEEYANTISARPPYIFPGNQDDTLVVTVVRELHRVHLEKLRGFRGGRGAADNLDLLELLRIPPECQLVECKVSVHAIAVHASESSNVACSEDLDGLVVGHVCVKTRETLQALEAG